MAVRRSDAVITTNHSRARVLSERHGCCEITVLHNVPPVKETVTPDPTGFPNGVVVLLYQGGIYARTRAFQETIQALKLLPDVHFVIVGFGRETDIDQIRVWALEYDVSDRVHLLPPRPFDALVDCAAAATVGLVPIKALRLNHYLGDTNKLHEYLMAGLPVVGSDLPEIRRVITEGDPQVGEVFDPTSPESIASAVSQVLRDGAGYEARRRQARQLALNSHNWEIEETQLLEMYNGLAR
jgi:glycosyltransferase involved in cell wall biosynthesis